jgi:hypothetical protein
LALSRIERKRTATFRFEIVLFVVISDVPEPQSQHTGTNGSITGRYIAFSLIFVGLVLFYRKPDALLNPQFWAEDGTVFFQDNYARGLAVIFAPHAGYFQLLLRLIAYLAGWFPLELQPAAYNYFSFGITIAVVAKLFSKRLHFPRPFLFAAAVPLMTHTGEILLCLTNLHWITSLLLVFLLIQDHPASKMEAFGDLAILVLMGLTGPHIIFLAPLFLLRLGLQGWQKWDAIQAGAAVLIAVIQIVALRQPPVAHFPTPPFSEWLQVFAWKPVAPLLFGWHIGAYISPVVTAFLLCGLLTLVFWSIRLRPNHVHAVLMIMSSGILALVSVAYRFTSTQRFFDGAGAGERYFLVPRLALVWSFILCVESDWRRSKVIAVVFAMAFCAAMADFQVPPLPDLRWTEQVANLRSGKADTLTINPVGWGPIQLRLKRP